MSEIRLSYVTLTNELSKHMVRLCHLLVVEKIHAESSQQLSTSKRQSFHADGYFVESQRVMVLNTVCAIGKSLWSAGLTRHVDYSDMKL